MDGHGRVSEGGSPIVVGVDGSPESRAALRWAIDEARLRGTEVVALYAWAYPELTEVFAPGSLLYDVSFLRSEGADFLEAVIDEAGGGGATARPVVVEGDAAEALLEASEDAALLVLGSRGLGGVASLVLGSVSSRCAREAACPVVIVRDQRARGGIDRLEERDGREDERERPLRSTR